MQRVCVCFVGWSKTKKKGKVHYRHNNGVSVRGGKGKSGSTYRGPRTDHVHIDTEQNDVRTIHARTTTVDAKQPYRGGHFIYSPYQWS